MVLPYIVEIMAKENKWSSSVKKQRLEEAKANLDAVL
jgi:hypothetical protein